MYKGGFYTMLVVAIGFVAHMMFQMNVEYNTKIQSQFVGQEITGFDHTSHHVLIRTTDRFFLFGYHNIHNRKEKIQIEELFTGEKRERLWKEIVHVDHTSDETRVFTEDGAVMVITGELETVVERPGKEPEPCENKVDNAGEQE